MKNIVLSIAFLTCSAFSFCNESDAQFHKPKAADVIEGEPGGIEIAFSPNYGGTDCTELICAKIGESKVSLIIQAYNFTSQPIGAAIIAAKKRGVDVHIILDHVATSEKGCQGAACQKAGCEVCVDAKHKIAHNKLIIIDGKTVIGGSFNYSANAEEHNAENVMIVHNEAIAALYIKNWAEHHRHSEPFKDK